MSCHKDLAFYATHHEICVTIKNMNHFDVDAKVGFSKMHAVLQICPL